MASSHCNSRCLFIFLLVLCSCFLLVPSFSLTNEPLLLAPFNSLYTFGDGNSSAVDHIAATLNMPRPQPYNTELVTEFHESGLNFATPGATIMKPFFFLSNGIPPPPQSHDLLQIVSFMKFFYKHCFSLHDCGKNKLLQKALVFMDQPGINDYKQAFLHGKFISEASHLVPEVVETIKNSVERFVNEAEAKTVMVSGILPIGCFPGFRTLFPEGDSIGQTRCHEGLNIFAKLHNDHLWQAILELRLKHPDVHIIYADYYKAFMAVVKSHAFLGFKTNTLMKACCGSGTGPFNFDMQNKCGEEGASICSDRASYIHWDGFRLTPEALENLNNRITLQPAVDFLRQTRGSVRVRHRKRKHITIISQITLSITRPTSFLGIHFCLLLDIIIPNSIISNFIGNFANPAKPTCCGGIHAGAEVEPPARGRGAAGWWVSSGVATNEDLYMRKKKRRRECGN